MTFSQEAESRLRMMPQHQPHLSKLEEENSQDEISKDADSLFLPIPDRASSGFGQYAKAAMHQPLATQQNLPKTTAHRKN